MVMCVLEATLEGKKKIFIDNDTVFSFYVGVKEIEKSIFWGFNRYRLYDYAPML